MKRFYAIFAAMLISICSFASRDVVPADAVLADYYDQGNVCVCIFVPDSMACNDIVLTGSFNNWSSNVANCAAVEPVEGYDGWYVASFEPGAEQSEADGVCAKPIMLDVNGNFWWDYQIGAATAIRGGVQVVPGTYAGEIDLKHYGTDAPNVFTVDAWKQNPCTAIYHNYTVTVVSDGCGGYVVPFIVGGMNGWSFQQMQYSPAKSAEYGGVPTYEISFKAPEGTPYQIVSGKLNDLGEMEVEPAWTDDAYMQMIVDGAWQRIPGEDGGNQLTHENANIVWDLREDTLQWARCDETPAEYVIVALNLPTGCRPEAVEIIGGFDGWEGTAMELLNTGWHFVQLEAKANQSFMVRGAGSWDVQLEFYNAENNEWYPIQDNQLVFGELWSDDTYKGTPCKWIELDFSDPAVARWSDCVEPIVPATTPKLWPIVMDNETFNANRQYVISNLRWEDEISNLYIWASGETYSPGQRSGLNFYGNDGDYLSLDVVAPDGWSGAGFSVEDYQAMEAIRALANTITNRQDSIYLHIAIKSTTAGSHEFCMFGSENISFTLGTSPINMGQVFSDFARDGEWHEFYIPVNPYAGALASTMLSNSTNIVYFLSGSAVGAELDLDAIYFCNAAYKNAGTALAITSGACGDNLTWNYEDSVLTISGTGDMWHYIDYVEYLAPWRYQPIKSVVIEEGVTSIGEYAFYQCPFLTTLELPSTMNYISYSAFYACNALTTIHAHGARPASIEWSSFSNINTYSVSVYVPFGSGSAYRNSSYWNEFNIIEPESGSGQCGENLFYTYADSVLTITGTGDMWDYSDYSYYGYDRAPWTNHPVISATMEEGATSIGNYAFYYTNIPSFDIPSSVTRIGSHAFTGCSGLTSVIVPDGVTRIGYEAFANCSNLTHLYIPATVEEIDSEVLYGDLNLTYLNAPASTLRGYYTENRLDTLIVNRGELEKYAYGTIALCNKTMRHMDLGATENIELQDEAFAHFYNLRSLVLPQGLEKINYMAIANCKSLESITIPASVTEIGMSAFENCYLLESVNFAQGSMLNTIGVAAFYNCHELQSINIPEGVTEIGKLAFYDCTYLNDVVVPSSVQAIGDNAFALCARMQQMRVKAAVPPSIASKTFEQVSREMPVYVPMNSVNAYKADPLWDEMNIIGVDEQWDAVDNVTTSTAPTKQLINGQLYILRGDKTYSVQGQEVK